MAYAYINSQFALARYDTNGNLDTTFSGDGKSLALHNAGIRGLALDASGRIVAAGSKDVGGYLAWALARFKSDGTLDNTFSGDGWLVENYGVNADAHGNAVNIDSTGKVVVAGYATIPAFSGKRQFILARYKTDGTLDANFSVDGKVETDFNNQAGAMSAAIDANGKIVAVGHPLGNSDGFHVARYNLNGTLDNSFSGGKVTTSFAGATYAGATAVAIDTSGRIVVAGVVKVNNVNQFAIARYKADGSLDNNFAGSGKVTTSFGAGVHAGALSVAIGGGNQIVVAGYAQNGGNNQFAVARYHSDGTLDTGFAVGGKAMTSFGANAPATAHAVTIDPDARVIVAGEATLNGKYQFALARYTAGGNPDTTFSSDGKLTTEFIAGGGAVAYDVALDAGGKIVAGGWAASWGELPPG